MEGGELTFRVAMTPTGDNSVMPQECRTSTPMLQAPHSVNYFTASWQCKVKRKRVKSGFMQCVFLVLSNLP